MTRTGTTIPPCSIIAVAIKGLPEDKDFLFEPEYNGATYNLGQGGAIYAHVVDCNISHIQVQFYE